MATKNLGQVAGVYVGTTPPSNINLIWYDSTPSQQCHKVYNFGTTRWDKLEQYTISNITYSELVNIAKSVGLSIGTFFQITDRANILALSITTTKVVYVDVAGNVVIDDLGTNIQYLVPASNIRIDGTEGVFDESSKTLNFPFNGEQPLPEEGDWLVGEVSRKNNVKMLVKYKISSFFATAAGNSITWNNGFYFNFADAIASILDKSGGVVSKELFDDAIKILAQNIGNVGKDNQELLKLAYEYTEAATTAANIFAKAIPVDLTLTGEPIDIAKGDSFIVALSKIQRYINRFKLATGVCLTDNFSPYPEEAYPNVNDTVETAMRKVSYWINRLKETNGLSVSAPFTEGKATDVIAGDTLTAALGKLQALAKAPKSGTGIEDSAVTNSKIADGAVTESKIANNSVTNSKIAASAVTNDKLAPIVRPVILSSANQDITLNDSTLSVEVDVSTLITVGDASADRPNTVKPISVNASGVSSSGSLLIKALTTIPQFWAPIPIAIRRTDNGVGKVMVSALSSINGQQVYTEAVELSPMGGVSFILSRGETGTNTAAYVVRHLATNPLAVYSDFSLEVSYSVGSNIPASGGTATIVGKIKRNGEIITLLPSEFSVQMVGSYSYVEFNDVTKVVTGDNQGTTQHNQLTISFNGSFINGGSELTASTQVVVAPNNYTASNESCDGDHNYTYSATRTFDSGGVDRVNWPSAPECGYEYAPLKIRVQIGGGAPSGMETTEWHIYACEEDNQLKQVGPQVNWNGSDMTNSETHPNHGYDATVELWSNFQTRNKLSPVRYVMLAAAHGFTQFNSGMSSNVTVKDQSSNLYFLEITDPYTREAEVTLIYVPEEN